MIHLLDTPQPGTYALVMSCTVEQTIIVGRLGEMRVQPGWYVYVGSALGPGGLAARLGRHAAGNRPLHWHVDYLRKVCRVEEAWYAQTGERLEHAWAEIVASLPGATLPVARFGASDCACRTHLFHFASPPSFDAFKTHVVASLGARDVCRFVFC